MQVSGAEQNGVRRIGEQQHRVERLHGGAGGALTLAAFFERIDTLAESADERGQAILEALYDYAEGIAPEPP